MSVLGWVEFTARHSVERHSGEVGLGLDVDGHVAANYCDLVGRALAGVADKLEVTHSCFCEGESGDLVRLLFVVCLNSQELVALRGYAVQKYALCKSVLWECE